MTTCYYGYIDKVRKTTLKTYFFVKSAQTLKSLELALWGLVLTFSNNSYYFVLRGAYVNKTQCRKCDEKKYIKITQSTRILKIMCSVSIPRIYDSYVHNMSFTT